MKQQRNRPAAHGRQVISILVAGMLAVVTSLAQSQKPADSTSHQASEADLAKASQNPVANLISLPLQYNYYTAGGLQANSEMVLNVQPVLPLPMGKRFLLVSRTIVPFVSIPVANPIPVVNGIPVTGFVDSIRTGGTADIQEEAFVTPTKPGKVTWALGPIFSFPTATNRLARTGQWGLGPTGVALVEPDPWVIGLLLNNVWRIGGDAHGHVLNTFTAQPFINYNLPFAWAISTAPLITSNWSAPSGEKWTVPIGIGVSKVTHIGDQAMSFLIQYYHNLNHPGPAGAEQLRLEATMLWPTAATLAKAKAKAKAAGKGDDQSDKDHGGAP